MVWHYVSKEQAGRYYLSLSNLSTLVVLLSALCTAIPSFAQSLDCGEVGKVCTHTVDQNIDHTLTWTDILGREHTGTIRYRYIVTGTLDVDPYIVAAGSSAGFTLTVKLVRAQRISETGSLPLDLIKHPCVFFGRGGTFAGESLGRPFFSIIRLFNNQQDRFRVGTFELFVDNGDDEEIVHDVIVTAESIISSVVGGGTSPWSLVQSGDGGWVMELQNRVQQLGTNILDPTLRKGCIYSGGSLEFRGFRILPKDSGLQIGGVIADIPVYAALATSRALGVVQSLQTKELDPLDLDGSFVRGDHLPAPRIEMTASKYSIAPGELDTLTMTLADGSWTGFDSGTISLLTASAQPNLILESAGTHNYDPGRVYTYVVRGGDVGKVRPQATVRLEWGWPAESRDAYEETVTLDSVITVAQSIGVEDEGFPQEYSLSKNYPNPFNPTTTISYALPQPSDVILTVYDVLGRQVRELASGVQAAGTRAIVFDATNLPSGIYFYRLVAGDFVETKRMVVLR